VPFVSRYRLLIVMTIVYFIFIDYVYFLRPLCHKVVVLSN